MAEPHDGSAIVVLSGLPENVGTRMCAFYEDYIPTVINFTAVDNAVFMNVVMYRRDLIERELRMAAMAASVRSPLMSRPQ